MNISFDKQISSLEREILLKSVEIHDSGDDFQFELNKFFSQKVIIATIKNFSSGMSARLGFAIATIQKPDILIVDEVLAVGDFAFQQKCKKRMEELLRDGTTLLFVSHAIEQVEELCQKAIWINNGMIEGFGNVKHISKEYMKKA